MLVFRKGKWMTVSVPSTDPMLGTHHKQRLASAIGTRVARGQSAADATRAAEAEIYQEIFPGLSILREEHSGPQHNEK
jgi:hypothetical protein